MGEGVHALQFEDRWEAALLASRGQVYACDEGWKFWYRLDCYCVHHQESFGDAEAAEREMRRRVTSTNRNLAQQRRRAGLARNLLADLTTRL